MAEITPMMKQYLEIKEQNKDSILFFRLGDFYEMFNEDAQLASRELDLTLTTRDRGKAAEDQTPMCGIPYHSSDAYIARLIAKGYKVAICEQTEDPALAKGLVKRDIIRVITPGTVIDSACLDDRRGNFLCGIFLDGQNAGAAFCDMTTGHTHVTAFSGDDRAEHLYNELSRFSPAEAVLSALAYENEELVSYLRDRLSCAVERGENRFELKACEKAIRAQFSEERFASLPRNNPAASLALGALLSYLHETQKTDLSYIKDLEYYEQGRFMELDLSARRNLELTETLRGFQSILSGDMDAYPEAAFYIFPRIDAKRFGIQNDEQFVLDFLREKHVLLVHGGGFNWANPDHFRIVYLPEVSILTESMKKMDEFLEKYR